MFLLVIVVTLQYETGAASELDTRISTHRITNATNLGLETASGGHIAPYGLLWTSRLPAWYGVKGQTVRLDQRAFAAAGLARNRYGDLYGVLQTASGQWIQRQWVLQGHAIWRGVGPYPAEERDALLQAEATARRNGAGIWASLQIHPATDFKWPDRPGLMSLVEGRVTAVHRTAGWTYLNFGENWKTDFTAAISSPNRGKFATTGWKIGDLENTWIRMRGYVREYNGPFMELQFPEQVEILEPGAMSAHMAEDN